MNKGSPAYINFYPEFLMPIPIEEYEGIRWGFVFLRTIFYADLETDNGEAQFRKI